MARKKIERVDVHIQLPKDIYKMSEQLTKGYKTLTQVLVESLIFQYQYHFKSDKLIDTSIPSNREVVKQLQKESENKPAINEAEELERLKALRKAKKVGDNHD